MMSFYVSMQYKSMTGGQRDREREMHGHMLTAKTALMHSVAR